MSKLKICRICLRTEAKVYHFDRFQLKCYYEEIMALKVNDEDDMPHYFCNECATLLHKFHKFKEKCYNSQQILKELLWKGPLRNEDLYKIDRKNLHLKSSIDMLTQSKRVKTYKVVFEEQDFLMRAVADANSEPLQEPLIIEHTYSKPDSPESSVSGGSPNFEPEIDMIINPVDDEKPTLLDTSDVKDANESGGMRSPTAIFIGEPNLIVNMPNKSESVKNIAEKIIAIKPKVRKYKYKYAKKPTNNLDISHWKKFNLTEEEAVKEFRARAESRKYLAARYKCTDCFKGFSKKDMLSRHTYLRHNESLGASECRFCRMRFKWDCLVRKHMRQHFIKYQCLRCNLVCSLENTALLHEEYHNGIKRKCKYCNEEFKHASTYYTHLRTHRSEYVCTLCGVSFVSKAGLHQHKKVKHVTNQIENPDDDDDDDMNTHCTKCDITFETPKAYMEHLFHSAMHVEGVENDSDYEQTMPRKLLAKKEQSKICSELHKSSGDDPLQAFAKQTKKRRRLRRKPMDCHQCGKHFETQAACMKHHLAEHPRTSFFSSTERHICEICGASLAPGSVAMHQNIHSRNKVFSCDTCGRSFHSSVGLKRHLVTHTGEKPYACTLCDKRFTQSNSMKLHYRTFHLKEPYPKRNRRKKKDEPHTTTEGPAEESKTDESSEDSVPEATMRPTLGPTVIHERPEENIHYLTLQ